MVYLNWSNFYFKLLFRSRGGVDHDHGVDDLPKCDDDGVDDLLTCDEGDQHY